MKTSNILIVLLLLISFQSIGQNSKEKKVLLFNKSQMSFKDNIFVSEKAVFRCIGKKKYINYDSVKKLLTNTEEMNAKIIKHKDYNTSKKPDFYYSKFYEIYILIKTDKKHGYLYPVERIWIVNSKIVD
ncbi:MAG: hypothetical protein ABI576_05830 [Flavobacterium sp.]